jgi:hypothetical protein
MTNNQKAIAFWGGLFMLTFILVPDFRIAVIVIGAVVLGAMLFAAVMGMFSG